MQTFKKKMSNLQLYCLNVIMHTSLHCGTAQLLQENFYPFTVPLLVSVP